MLIDCSTCSVRDLACDDCVVTALLGPPRADALPEVEARALAVLTAAGLISAQQGPLRLVAGATTAARVRVAG